MSEGEIKKRMEQVFVDFGKDEAKFIVKPFVDIVDEARRDIFSAIHVEQGDGIRRRDINAIKLFAALDKWFGLDTVTPVKVAVCSKCGTRVKCLKGDCEMGTCPLCGWDVYFV